MKQRILVAVVGVPALLAVLCAAPDWATLALLMGLCIIASHELLAAVLRAAEIEADIILLAKNIDGVYDSDPAKNADAVKFDSITYDEVLKRHLAVMDSTATSLSMDNHIPVLVFALKDPQNIIRALRGEKIGTIVKEA